MPKANLTASKIRDVKASPPEKARVYYWDKSKPGFGFMVTDKGHSSYIIQYRGTDDRTKRITLKGTVPFSEAKKQAAIILGQVAKGRDPVAEDQAAQAARKNTLEAVAEEYLADDRVSKLRSFEAKKRELERYIFPAFGSRPINEIKRSEIVRLLERIKRKHGPGAANNAFKGLSALFTWYVPRDDNFNNPIVRGTYSQTKGEGSRTLTDDEIRILWNVASAGEGPYDHLMRFILLSGTRIREAANLSRTELSPDGNEWTIPEARYKGETGKSHAHLIPLSDLAKDVLAQVPVLQVNGKDSEWVFTTTGTVSISGFSQMRAKFDKRLRDALAQEGSDTHKRIVADLHSRYPAKGYEPFDKKWTPHSLRKTARTLMERVSIAENIAEKALGHVKGGIVGTYNHHEYKAEKAQAFAALAREVERIARNEPAKVIQLRRA